MYKMLVSKRWVALPFLLMLTPKLGNAQNQCVSNNLLVNGSFETPIGTNTDGSNNIRASSLFSPWTNSSTTPANINVVRLLTGNYAIGPNAAVDGVQYIDLIGSTGIMDQTVTLTQPACLNYSGYFANRQYIQNASASQVGIQIFNSRNEEIAVQTASVGPAQQYNWVPVNSISSLLQPGQYRFRFFGRNDLLHYDHMNLCIAETGFNNCNNVAVLNNPGNWSAAATHQYAANFLPSLAINNNISDLTTNSWAIQATNVGTASITFDYKTPLDLLGFVYYARTAYEQDLKHYKVSYSNDGINFTDIQTGSLERQSRVYPTATGNPIVQHFKQQVSAQYLKLTVVSGYNSGNPVAMLQLLPIVCNPTNNYPNIGCGGANLLNSGTNENGSGKKAKYTFDNNWKVAFYASTNNLSYAQASKLTYLPAIVCANAVPNSWANSPFGNAEWISYTPSSYDVNSTGTGDGSSPNAYYYKYNFNLTDPYLVNAFKLKIDFYVDNNVQEIYINGVSQSSKYNLPAGGFTQSSRVTTELNSDWVLGVNEILVKTFSRPGHNGFLIQNVSNCVGVDFGDAPTSYNVDRLSNGPGHIIETINNVVQLCLGNTVNASNDGNPSINADGDATDEDGIVGSFPGITHENNPTVSNYTVAVKVKNTTGKTAYLVGWIDWNRNGSFESTEGVKVPVPNNSNTANLVWSTALFVGNPSVDHTYARFRLSTDDLNINDMVGAASDGEVEDYKVIFPSLCQMRVLIPKASSNWVASSNVAAVNTIINRTIDGNLEVGNHITIDYSNLPAEITYDYGSIQSIGGFVYYPNYANSAAGRLDIEGYDVLISNDNVNFSLVTSGTMNIQPMTTTTSGSQIPQKVLFTGGLDARYMKLVIKRPSTNRQVAILELLPITCQNPTGFTAGCGTAPLFNSGTNSIGNGKKMLATFDNNWEVTAVSNRSNYSYLDVKDSIFYPAVVVGNKAPNAWINSPFGNSEWISWAPSGHDPNDIMDYFFKTRFYINDEYELSAFYLNMDFYADNSVQNIYVNGIGIAPAQNLPQSTSYTYQGFLLNNVSSAQISENFKLGYNEIIVHIRSNNPYNGFLAQNKNNCIGFDFGDAPSSYNVSRAQFGAGHVIDSINNGVIPVKLGTLIDGENDGTQSLNAAADDDNASINDEDGVTFDSMTVTYCLSNNYSVLVRATNLTNTPAILVGWIDFDGNGQFDAVEGIQVPVPAQSNNILIPLNWTNKNIGWSVNTPYTYARFRIASNDISLETPNGLASNGEVEDYIIPLKWIHHDFGNLDADFFPIASAQINQTNQVWLGLDVPNEECATQLNDAADGLSTSQVSSGIGTYNDPWLISNNHQSLNFELTLNSNNLNQDIYWAIWVDLDGNATFNDQTDVFLSGNAIYQGSPITVPIVIPRGNVLNLGPSYLRVIVGNTNLNVSATTNATGSFGNGEVEDYYINFVESLPIQWISVNGKSNGKHHELNWIFDSNKENITHFNVEKYENSGSYNTIGKVPFEPNKLTNNYTVTKMNNMEAISLYYIKAMNDQKEISRSPIIVINEINSKLSAIVYPNPVNYNLHIDNLYEGSKIIITNVLGQVVLDKIATQPNEVIETNAWQQGFYLIQIHSQSYVETIKIIKE